MTAMTYHLEAILRLAFVVQRYGLEINGGAERLCRLLAENLRPHCQSVTVFTTCAKDYNCWENAYPPGRDMIAGVEVLRFPLSRQRHPTMFNALYDVLTYNTLFSLGFNETVVDGESSFDAIFYSKQRQKALLDKQPLLRHYDSLDSSLIPKLESAWMQAQGPISSELNDYIERAKDKYDAFFFVCYNYATTFTNIHRVGPKAVLIPTFHKEVCITFSLFQKMMERVCHFVFLTKEEQALAHFCFPQIKDRPQTCVALGVETDLKPRSRRLLDEIGLGDLPYFIYIGRVDKAKGCDSMIESFLAYKKQYQTKAKLVLVGKIEFELTKHPDIIALGFVEEDVKTTLLAYSLALILPSVHESLSIAVLEAFAQKKCVVVTAKSDVLKSHVVLSGGGLCYQDNEELLQALSQVENEPEHVANMGQKGFLYVQKNYSWEHVVKTYLDIAASLAANQKRSWWSKIQAACSSSRHSSNS